MALRNRGHRRLSVRSRAFVGAALSFAALGGLFLMHGAFAQEPAQNQPQPEQPKTDPMQMPMPLPMGMGMMQMPEPMQPGMRGGRGGMRVGLVLNNEAKSYQGYTLFAPLTSRTTYLIDMVGKVVKSWEGAGNPASSTYLLPNGNLLRPCTLQPNPFGMIAAAGGRVQEFNWEGEVVWDYQFASATQLPHHDIRKLPNGNVLLIVADRKNAQQTTAAGRRAGGIVNSDSIIEVKPTGKTTGEVVWQWNLWDHLIQDVDAALPNHGEVAAHPELVDVNFGGGGGGGRGMGGRGMGMGMGRGMMGPGGMGPPGMMGPGGMAMGPGGRGMGMGGRGPGGGGGVDWTHINAVDYNPELDQIVMSIHEFSEFWIIDHSTTTEEAASHSGGKSGKGGDLLYRWGNARVYKSGTNSDQRLYAQHNVHWIPKGLPGAGNILVFNNGSGRPGGAYSSIDEIVPPIDKDGKYTIEAGKPYGPDKAVWTYAAPQRSDFYSSYISGTQRLANGNTLICSGADGTFFEVSTEGETVWRYVNPDRNAGRGGRGPMMGGPPGGMMMPGGPGMGVPMAGGPGGMMPGGGGRGERAGSVFRASRYAADYSGLKDKDLTPGKLLEDVLAGR